MSKPLIQIRYNKSHQAENAYALAKDYERLGFKVQVGGGENANITVVTDEYDALPYEVARQYVQHELDKLKVDFLLLENGIGLPLPAYETAGAAGMDLRAAWADFNAYKLKPGERVLVPCGFAIALPERFEAQIRPRSGLAIKHGITVLNSPGTIDSDYRGQVMAMLINHGTEDFVITRGERVAQMVIAPVTQARFVTTASLPSTTRGEGGFGSTGK